MSQAERLWRSTGHRMPVKGSNHLNRASPNNTDGRTA
jgi:hypothetical protein